MLQEAGHAGFELDKAAIASTRSRLPKMLERFCRQMSADVATFYLYDGATWRFYLPIGYGLRDLETFSHDLMLPRSDRVAGAIVTTNKPIIAEQVRGHGLMDGPFARREGIVSAAGFPVKDSRGTSGVLFVSYRRRHCFPEAERKQIETFTATLARAIRESKIQPALERAGKSVRDEQDKLQMVGKLVCSFINMPAVIWIPSTGDEFRIVTHTGVPHEYVTKAAYRKGDHSAVARAFASGSPVPCVNIQQSPIASLREHASRAGWHSTLAYPVSVRGGQVEAVLEAFTFEPHRFTPADMLSMRPAVEMVKLVLDDVRRSRESQRLVQVTRALSTNTDIAHSLQVIAEAARELTNGDSSSIYMLQKRGRFAMAAHAPAGDLVREGHPRTVGGLTQRIMHDGRAVRVDEAAKYKGMRSEVVAAGIQSLVGVCLRLEHEPIGVLYVNGKRRSQFSDADVSLLQSLADHASLALGWARMVLRPSGEVEQAISNLFNLDSILDAICQKARNSIGFDFAAVQLIRPEDQVIETVHCSGMDRSWSGLAKHPIVDDERLRDIQADIAYTRRTEIISGWDNRFDRWVYDEFGHAQLSRIFTPIMVVYDRDGKPVENWFEQCKWKRKAFRGGQHVVYELIAPQPGAWTMDVIGTLEAGLKGPGRRITNDMTRAVVKLVAGYSLQISRARLPGVLAAILERTAKFVGAHSATLHFLYDPDQRRYVYQAAFGDSGEKILVNHPPRPGGLGESAIKLREPLFIPNPAEGHSEVELERLNPNVFAAGVRAMAAMPLAIDDKTGVLYLHFHKPHSFTEDEIEWMQLFAYRAVDAIRHALAYTELANRTRQLTALHSVTQLLVSSPAQKNLPTRIAWTALNMLAADVVTIYEYIQPEKRFVTPPTIAGPLCESGTMQTAIGEFDAPALLVKHGKNVYETQSEGNEILMDSNRKRNAGRDPFVKRERIRSSAGVLLRSATHVVGVMFINFRRRHTFTEEESKVIDTLAYSASIAFSNQQLLSSLTEVDREIISAIDLGDILKLVLRKAVQVTGAVTGELYGIDDKDDRLALWAREGPELGERDQDLERIRQRVIISGHAELSAGRDVICVPMVHRGGRSIGVLLVGADRPGAFDQAQQRMLEALATPAVIAIQNADHQKRSIAAATMGAIGDIAFSIVHRAKDDIGAIRVWSRDIQQNDSLRAAVNEKAAQIEGLADRFLGRLNRLGRCIIEPPALVDVGAAIEEAISQVELPGSIHLNARIPPDLPQISGAREPVIGVFENLIQNAIRAMPSGGDLQISAEILSRRSGEWLIVTVSDTGCGMSEAEIRRVFQPKLPDGATGGGHGFGLWWSRYYLESVGGSLEIQTSCRSTSAILTFPAARRAEQQAFVVAGGGL